MTLDGIETSTFRFTGSRSPEIVPYCRRGRNRTYLNEGISFGDCYQLLIHAVKSLIHKVIGFLYISFLSYAPNYVFIFAHPFYHSQLAISVQSSDMFNNLLRREDSNLQLELFCPLNRRVRYHYVIRLNINCGANRIRTYDIL